MCAGGRSRVKPLVPIVAYRWFALVCLTGQAGFYAGGRMAKVRGASFCWRRSWLIPPEGVRNQALSSPLRSAVLLGRVALPLVRVAWPSGALRLNRDLLAEELDLIFPSDPS